MTAPPREFTAPLGRRFNLFAECVVVGLVVVLACLPIVTWVAAFAAGSRWLDRYLDDRRSGVRVFVADLRAALPGTAAVALAGFAVFALLAVDLMITSSGIPGGAVLAGVLAVLVVPLVLSQLRVAATWQLDVPWWRQWGAAVRRTITDPAGSLLLLAAALLVVVVTWQLPPLVVPGMGCLTMAAVGIERRAARRGRKLSAIGARLSP